MMTLPSQPIETTQPSPMPPTNITLTEAHRHANGRETCTGALVLDPAAQVATCAACGRAWDVILITNGDEYEKISSDFS